MIEIKSPINHFFNEVTVFIVLFNLKKTEDEIISELNKRIELLKSSIKYDFIISLSSVGCFNLFETNAFMIQITIKTKRRVLDSEIEKMAINFLIIVKEGIEISYSQITRNIIYKK